MNKPKKINRREFLKLFGMGAAATTARAACTTNSKPTEGKKPHEEVPTDKMTYRKHPKTGEQVSILGYGCMRWPTKETADGKDEEIDQEAVNALVDYAIAHGVNYFDTAPPYCRGLSEKVTGIALKRHPRKSYYIATKMSNFDVIDKGLSPKESFDT